MLTVLNPPKQEDYVQRFSEPSSSTDYMQIFIIKTTVLVPGSGVRYIQLGNFC